MVSTTAPMSFSPARRAWMANGGLRIAAAIVLSSRIASKRRNGAPASWMVYVAARKAVPLEDFVQHERPAGVGDVGHERPPAQVGDPLDVRLHEQMIEAVVAAGDDNGVHARLDQRHALVGGAVHDRVAAVREALALLLGVRRGLQIDGEAAPGEKSLRLRGEQRQRLRAGKHHDGELGLGRCHQSAGQRRQPAEAHLPAVRRPPRVVAGLVDRLRLIARMLRRVVVPPFGALRAARQTEAEDLLDLLEGQDEIVALLLQQIFVQRLVFVLVVLRAMRAQPLICLPARTSAISAVKASSAALAVLT